MYICLCLAVTSSAVQKAIDEGARSTKQVASSCGAGSVCGRCRPTVRTMLDAAARDSGEAPPDASVWTHGTLPETHLDI